MSGGFGGGGGYREEVTGESDDRGRRVEVTGEWGDRGRRGHGGLQEGSRGRRGDRVEVTVRVKWRANRECEGDRECGDDIMEVRGSVGVTEWK